MKNIISKLFLGSFVGYWCVSLIISLFNPFGMYKVSLEAYIILLLNVYSFVLGYISIKQNRESHLEDMWINIDKQIARVVNNKCFLFLLLLACIMCIKIYIDYAAAFELLERRTDSKLEALTGSGGFTILMYSYFLSPFFYVIVPIFVLSLFYRREKIPILIMLVYVISYSLIGGRRQTFFTVIIAFFFIYFIGSRIQRGKKVYSKYIYILILIGTISMYVMMCFVTAMMGGTYHEWNAESLMYGMNTLNETFIRYSILPFRLFDYAIHNHYYEILGNTYGLSTFSVIHKYIAIVLGFLGFDISDIRDALGTYLQDTILLVGTDQIANYSYTNALFFYLDFKVPGVIVFSFMFGLFVHYIIIKSVGKPSIPAICLLFYIYFVVIHTVFTWHIFRVFSIMLILLLSYASFDRKPNICNNM